MSISRPRGPLTLFSTSRTFRRWVAFMSMLPVLYVASIGPICWISSYAGYGSRVLAVAYHPVLHAWHRSPRAVSQFLAWYTRVGAADGWAWHYANDVEKFDWGGSSYPSQKPPFPFRFSSR